MNRKHIQLVFIRVKCELKKIFSCLIANILKIERVLTKARLFGTACFVVALFGIAHFERTFLALISRK